MEGSAMSGGVGRLEEYVGVPRKKFEFKDGGTKKKSERKKGPGKNMKGLKKKACEKKTTDQVN
jgi:hypothetical protein